MDYLWVYILAAISIVSVGVFIATFSKDLYLTRKLKLNRSSLLLDFSLLVTSLVSLSLVIYLFVLLKEQIQFFG